MSANTNVGIGSLNSLQNGTNNSAFGYNTLSQLTDGSFNTAIGSNALELLVMGNLNTALGYNAGYNLGDFSNTTCIGANTQATGDNQVILGDLNTTTYAQSLFVNDLSASPINSSEIPGVVSSVSGLLVNKLIYNHDISPNALISDNKLATINTTGKVANSATTATVSNNANTIVLRDNSGNIYTNVVGNVVGNVNGSALSSIRSGIATMANNATNATYATTQPYGTSNTTIANTQFVQTAINNIDLSGLSYQELYTLEGFSNNLISIKENATAGILYNDVCGNVYSYTTVTGNLRGNVTGNLYGNVIGGIGGDVTGNLRGNVTGDLRGNVTGNLNGNVTGDLRGNVTGNLTSSGNAIITGNLTGLNLIQTNSDFPVNKKISLYDPTNSNPVNATNFYGFGVNTLTLRYQTDSPNAFHRFYSGANDGLLIAGGLTLNNTTASTSTSTGSLIVKGGVGIVGNTYVGGNLLGNVLGNVTGNLIGNVTGEVVGNVSGNLQGSVTGDLTTQNIYSTSNLNIGVNSTTINIGGSNTTVNIDGSLNYIQTTNLEVKDKLITINKGGDAASASDSGITIEEDGDLSAGYIKTSANRSVFLIKAPAGNEGTMVIQDNTTNTVTMNNLVVSNITGNLNGSVTGSLVGNVTGDVVGNVTGNLRGNVEGNVTGNLRGNVVGNVSGYSIITNNFTGDFNINNWTLIENNGSINTTNLPTSVQLTSLNSEGQNTTMTITIPYNTTIQFTWNYTTPVQAYTRIFGYSVNGVEIQLTNDWTSTSQNGIVSVNLNTGDVFGFYTRTPSYNDPSSTITTVSNFNFISDVYVKSYVSGEVVGNVTGNLRGSVTGSLVGNVTGEVVGNVTGNLSGSVTGNLNGNVTGNLNGNVTGNLSGSVTGLLVGNVTGNLNGNVSGNLSGSVTGLLVGNVTGSLVGNVSGDVTGNLSGSFAIRQPQQSINTSLATTSYVYNRVFSYARYPGRSTGISGLYVPGPDGVEIVNNIDMKYDDNGYGLTYIDTFYGYCFVVPITGWYRVSINVLFGDTNNATWSVVPRNVKNGTPVNLTDVNFLMNNNIYSETRQGGFFQNIVNVTKGDVLTFYCSCTAARLVNWAQTSWELMMITT